MAKVSFILAAYKRRFLKEAIASILAQTYRDFQLVVVDDCSPEDLKSVVDEFHDERLSYHRNETNIGGKDLVAAWTRAMEYAHGEWCVLASDDDVWQPTCLERLMALVEKYPTCDLVHARSACIDAEGRWVEIAPVRRELESQIEMAYERSVRDACQQAPDFMFRLDAWRKIGGFVKFPLAWHTDDATWIALAKNGCAHTSDVEFCFRHSGINLSSSHDALVERKIEASGLYDKWLRDLSNKMTPATKEERYMLSVLQKGRLGQVKGVMLYVLAQTKSFKVWYRALKNPALNRHDRVDAICRRYPMLSSAREMIRRLRK